MTMRAFRVLPLMFTLMYSCHAQNGPTSPSVQLNWTQSTTPGVTANCVYRGTATKVYTMPALFCSTAPIVSYTDNSVVRGTTYFYAVTAQAGKIESQFSNEATAPVLLVNPPSGTGSVESKVIMPKLHDQGMRLEARVRYR